jgi:hypothetical protein
VVDVIVAVKVNAGVVVLGFIVFDTLPTLDPSPSCSSSISVCKASTRSSDATCFSFDACEENVQ